jgi:branched-chain amino acid transport system substrate-binding protein
MRRVTIGALGPMLVALAFTAYGCGGGGAEAGKGEKLTIGQFVDFSGPLGEQALTEVAGCLASQNAIKAAGGVLGHQLSCQRYDAGADPADAVPAAARMLSNAQNLVLTQGPDEVAAAVAPIISARKVVMMSVAGDAHFDKNTDPYFYRTVPSDDVAAEAMAFWAHKTGHKNVAMLFENGGGATTVIEPVKAALGRLKINIVQNLTIAPDQTSYRTEVQSLLHSHPEVILTETDSQTAATFFSELLELNGGKMLPLQGTAATVQGAYEEPLVHAIGAQNVEKYFEATNIAEPTPGPALTEYQHYLKTVGPEVPRPEQYALEPYSTCVYDSNIVAALAMVAAKATSPEKYQPYISKVSGAPGAGRVEVSTYAEGLKDLQAGKQIVYIGTSGPMLWDQYHNREGDFQALKYDPASRENKAIATITSQELKQVRGS